MTVPASLAALSTTAASNPPAGTDAVFPELDNHLRFTYSCLAQLRDERLPLAGGTLTGALIVGGPTVGTAQLNPGTASNGGYLAIRLAAGTRQGYIGNGVSGQIPIFAETGTYYNFTNVAPRSAVAAASATELVRKQEMDAGDAAAAAAAASATPIGSILPMARITAPTGWLLIDGKTIGSATSGATARANADTSTLYAYLWAFTPIEIQTSSGVTTTRGASAAADFASNKRLRLFNEDGGWFPRAWTPTQTVDASRAAATSQPHAFASHGHNLLSDNSGSGPAGQPSSMNGGNYGVGGTARSAGYLANNGVGTQIVESNGGTETRPYNVALPFYIRYA